MATIPVEEGFVFVDVELGAIRNSSVHLHGLAVLGLLVYAH